MRLAFFALPCVVLLAASWPGALGAPAGLAQPATPVSGARCEPAVADRPSPTPSATEEGQPGIDPTPTPALDPDAIVDPLLEPMVASAVANLQACWNADDWHAVAAMVTPRHLETALGITGPDEPARAATLAALDLGPLNIETISPIALWSDGRGAIDVFYWRGRGQPEQAVAARWFFLAARGVVHFDEEVQLLPPMLGDRVTVGFAIADDVQPLRWDSLDGGHVPISPVIALHGANRGLTAHTFLVQDARGETLGLLTLSSWQQGDLVLRDLPAGTYVLSDPAVVGSTLELEVGNE